MEDAADANSTVIASGLLRESTARLGGAALNYVLEDSYKGQYSQFDEYLKLETDNHDILSDYYVMILHREQAELFMTDLAVFLQDILFHDSPEVDCLEEIKTALLDVAVGDYAKLVPDIESLFTLYDQLNRIMLDSRKRKDACPHNLATGAREFTPEVITEITRIGDEALQQMRDLTKNHPYSKTWLL